MAETSPLMLCEKLAVLTTEIAQSHLPGDIVEESKLCLNLDRINGSAYPPNLSLPINLRQQFRGHQTLCDWQFQQLLRFQ